MKLLCLLILLLISLSWASTLAEGMRCEETDHQLTEWISDADSVIQESPRPCQTGSCHFGHCGHFVLRLQSTPLDLFAALGLKIHTPYVFALSSEPLLLPMRPPLGV